jgi:hypothetical protein
VKKSEDVQAVQSDEEQRGRFSPWYLLFLVELVAVLWVPFYNRLEPHWLGIPFFYWYQLLWIIIAATFTAVIYCVVRE